MKTVCNEEMCTGCGACEDVCKKSAISIIDSGKNNRPVIDDNKCINCGSCMRVCQNRQKIKFNLPIAWYQGWATSEEKRRKSSSGGFATMLATRFVNDGGIVCSCIFSKGEFCFDFFENAESISKISGSKYVKSNPKGVYGKIKKMLAEGRNVLFIGLPCQTAAVKLYVGEKYEEQLYLVDLICHGTPSPKHIKQFLSEKGYSLEQLTDISFRNKSLFHVVCDGQYMEHPKVYDNYSLAFLNCINYTENCYSCCYAKKERVSDITIGDSWGSDLPLEEQQKGISLALCQTKKGVFLLKNAEIELYAVDLEKAIAHNRQLERPSVKPKNYDRFFYVLEHKKSYKAAVKCGLNRTFCNQQIKKMLIRMGVIGRK